MDGLEKPSANVPSKESLGNRSNPFGQPKLTLSLLLDSAFNTPVQFFKKKGHTQHHGGPGFLQILGNTAETLSMTDRTALIKCQQEATNAFIGVMQR